MLSNPFYHLIIYVSSSHTHSVQFTNANIDFDFVTIVDGAIE